MHVTRSKKFFSEHTNGDDIHFSPPGAYHRARWMAKGIYCLKILLFREQFKMYAKELQALRRICLFTITLYVKAWYTAPVMLLTMICACFRVWNHFAALISKLQKWLYTKWKHISGISAKTWQDCRCFQIRYWPMRRNKWWRISSLFHKSESVGFADPFSVGFGFDYWQ